MDCLRRVAVCVVTYRRLQALGRLLGALAGQQLSPGCRLEVRVVVVDNDPNRSARPTVAAAATRLPWSVGYANEPTPGIAAARNTAVRIASQADAVVFVDDDEVPSPTWLAELVSVARRFDADVVGGPSLPFFPAGEPSWAVRGGFYQQRRHRTGEQVSVVASNNLLIRCRLAHEMSPLFDARFGLSGGSDTHFALRASRRGYRLVWADEAVVHEWVSGPRATRRWMLKRGFREGSGEARCEIALAHGWSGRSLTRLWRAGRGGARIVAGTLLILVGMLRLDQVRVLQGARVACRGLGMLTGAAGLHYAEYKRRTTDLGQTE